MAVPVVTTPGIPVRLVSIVVPGIAAIGRWIREPVRPLARHGMLAFDPAAQPRHVPQAPIGFRAPRKSDELYLNRRASICLGRACRMLERARCYTGVDMLVDRQLVDREVRNVVGLAILHERALRCPTL